ncbi:MAG TPA: 5-formyltetrahydrofolate cyclo-ligase [Chitinophagaceae bacterium]|jgi:5-formyltetrahydrofolate cyclo-ligase|nr:5-formyltetrahydrofolate cyclo-ligase [Chitinophagaceae bacterium]
MLKKEARRLFRAQRLGLSEGQRMKFDDLLLIQFQQLELPFLQTVLSYYPADDKGEINTFILTDYLRFRHPGLEIAYPRTHASQYGMDALVAEPESFRPNPYGIPEPEEGQTVLPEALDLVLVPMIICDRSGNRVGYGKGYYDRFLQQCRPDCLKVGLSYFEPVDRIDDAHEFDVPLDFCICPQKTYVF